MQTQATTPGGGPGAIQEPSAISLTELSPIETLLSALQSLAEREPSSLNAEFEIKQLSKTYGVGIRQIREHYLRIQSAYRQTKMNDAAAPTPEQIEAEKIADERRHADEEAKAKREAAERAEVDQIVEQLKQTPDLLSTFHYVLVSSGYICNRSTAASAWISHGARLLPDCTSFTFCGSSASGKSALVAKAAEFLPPDVVLNLTSLSEQALYYLGSVVGMYLIFGELAPTIEGQDDYRQRAMRQFLSEGKITRATVEKADGKTNDLEVKETIGPAVCIATTTIEAKRFNDEFQNRGIWFATDDSPETTKAVLAMQAERAANPVQPDDEAMARYIRAFQEYHRTLEPLTVEIPFAGKVIPTNEHVTARRQYPLLLNFIKCSALLHQHVRARKMVAGKPVIAATLDDYAVALDLMVASAPRVLETCPAPARKAFDEVIKPYMQKNNSIWTSRAVELLGRPEPTVRRWLEDYTEAGLTICTHRDGKKKIYELSPEGQGQSHFVQNLGFVPLEKLRHDGWAI